MENLISITRLKVDKSCYQMERQMEAIVYIVFRSIRYYDYIDQKEERSKNLNIEY